MGILRNFDRRREPRTPADLLVMVWGVDTQGERFLQEARAREVSLSGALLSGLDADLRSGDVVGVYFGKKKARFRVIWVRYDETGDKMQIAGYTLVCQSYTQDDKPNYESEWAVLDVYKNGKKVDTMFPERRFYKASEQTATIVANRSRLNEDLYLVYTGRNPDTGKPIIRAHVNPLVMWIWIGVNLMLIGTIIAMLPSARPAKYRVAAKEREAAEAVKQGAVEVGGD